MCNVLFIDDDNFMLRALSRLARRLRPDWHFWTEDDCLNWSKSLTANIKLDLVFCDYLMPACNGDKVLMNVALTHPGAVRVLLTGDTTENVVCNISRFDHFVVSKPFQEHDIEKVFHALERINMLPVSSAVKGMLCGSALLLPLPTVVRKINALLLNDEIDISDIVAIIEHEPVIAARILQLANSAFFGFPRTTHSLEEAVRRLGIKLTGAVVTSIAIDESSAPLLDPKLHRMINDEAFEVAMNTRPLCKTLGYNRSLQDELFAIALLSAIGELVMATDKWQGTYAEAFVSWSKTKIQAVISAFMLTIWGCSESVCNTLLWSYEPDFRYANDNFALILFLARNRANNGGQLPEEVLRLLPDESFRVKIANA